MLDSSGCLMVKYTYNAWGELLIVEGALANTLGRRNPFMYRGYMFDRETKLYYLRSRYYSSLISKFINMDNVIGTNKTLLNNHLFAYTRNNSIMYIDSSGQWYERIACLLASGEMKEKNIWVEGDRLYTGRGEVYQLNRPLTGATNGTEYQTIASSKASSSFFHAERVLATPFELDEDNQYTSLINIVNTFKNAMSWVDMNVYIESSQEGATRARITVQFHSNISVDAFDTGLYENAYVDSPVLTLIEMTSERGYFWDGNRGIYISNDQQWLTSLISKVELEG